MWINLIYSRLHRKHIKCKCKSDASKNTCENKMSKYGWKNENRTKLKAVLNFFWCLKILFLSLTHICGNILEFFGLFLNLDSSCSLSTSFVCPTTAWTTCKTSHLVIHKKSHSRRIWTTQRWVDDDSSSFWGELSL